MIRAGRAVTAPHQPNVRWNTRRTAEPASLPSVRFDQFCVAQRTLGWRVSTPAGVGICRRLARIEATIAPARTVGCILCTRSPESSRLSSRATPRLPSNSCRQSTRNCAGWQRKIWPRRKPGQTLQATALVHEAYLRLVDVKKAQRWNSRGHFFAAAAEAMRRILVEQARRKQEPKRGGDCVRVELDAACNVADPKAEEILAVSEALADLEEESPAAVQLVKLRYFGGMGHQEAADCLGISRTTADRYWAYAKASLFCALKDSRR